ncbi:DUF4198 domain-containing protein [Photobacterium phosphoreum]|uniref:DUF4198 domain-containing protein n=1 Tax=Photobacterium phosphoreum TaxID=659 RepID=UPI000D16AEC7|nr:DUF4198 domain-containing protein [Photobacterium phosphoreum]MCD9475256.1 DUF4198 domain-containing protein [Photobacterium phosphoreum]MCF2175960.1 DUF4198 domain-containing protein [Photobacterium phosphoreum]PSU76949.1 DUF4198 domain-containing protein [Photobacterium phosphoreum]
MMKNNKMKAFSLACAVIAGLAVSASANAHPRWVLPSHFTVSKEGGDWLSFDVTASHGTFIYDKPASTETAEVIMPDGRAERPNFTIRGKRRAIFDFYFEEEGTHKIQINQTPEYFTQYKAGRRDTVKWIAANKVERDAVLPAKSRDVVTQVGYTRAETYVTVGKPSIKAMEITGKYLELLPITHPADIVEGEPVTFQFYFNGKPQAGVVAEVTREGTLYRNHQEQIDVVSDAEGKVSFTPATAGRYIMKANYRGEIANNPMVDTANVNVHITFEASLQ